MYLEILYPEVRIRHQFGKIYLKNSRKLRLKSSNLKIFEIFFSLHQLIIRKNWKMKNFKQNQKVGDLSWHVPFFPISRTEFSVVSEYGDIRSLVATARRRISVYSNKTPKSALFSGFSGSNRSERFKILECGYRPYKLFPVKRKLKSEDPRVLP